MGKAAHKRKYTAKQVAAALLQHGGVVARAARFLGCAPTTVYDYVNSYSTVKEALQLSRRDTYAGAEESLTAMAEDPTHKDHRWAVQRLLQLYGGAVDDGVDHSDTDTSTSTGVSVVVQYPTDDIPDPD